MNKTLLTAAMLLAAVCVLRGDTIRIDGSTTVGPIVKAFAEKWAEEKNGTDAVVSESGSGNGAKSLVNGACDIAMLSRPLKKGEFKAAADKGIEPVPHAVAFDAIVPIVHPSNPVANLTLAQLKSIYGGQVTNWKALGGPDRKIVVVSRDANSGTFECFSELVMRKAPVTPSAETCGSNGAVRQRIETTPGAIGFVGIGYLDRTVKGLRVDGVEPTPAEVTAGRFPLSRSLFIYTAGYPKIGTPLFRFANLHLTRKGAEIIEALGFVPVTEY